MRSLLIAFAAALFSSMLIGCSGGDRPPASDNSDDVVVSTDDDAGTSTSGLTSVCDTDHVGCPCYNEGASFDCGRVHRRSGSYETCTEGTSTCTNGVWGACIGRLMVGSN